MWKTNAQIRTCDTPPPPGTERFPSERVCVVFHPSNTRAVEKCQSERVTSDLGWVNRVLRFRREAELQLRVKSQAGGPSVAGLVLFC